MANQVAKWASQGLVIPAPRGCRWNTPMIAVPKKDGQGGMTKLRICADLRHINALIGDSFPIPLIEDLLTDLSEARMYTTLDLEWSYLQFPVADEDQEKLAFTHELLHVYPCYLRPQAPDFNVPSGDEENPCRDGRCPGLRWRRSHCDRRGAAPNRSLAETHAYQVVEMLDRLTAYNLTVNPIKLLSLLLLQQQTTTQTHNNNNNRINNNNINNYKKNFNNYNNNYNKYFNNNKHNLNNNNKNINYNNNYNNILPPQYPTPKTLN
eukprot:Lithocolla_globosa_v1_NODE_260_length_4772_cov_3.217087.p4 type:complete len:265 gc:universal NODE_260_length_4772_cov_3.217087:2615-1821(-)